MSIDLAAAVTFLHTEGRLLERHRLAHWQGTAGTAPILATLAAYANPDGGFGHGLEPDVRCPGSQPASTLHAIEVLADVDALDDPLAQHAVAWLGSIATPNGLVPQVLPSADGYPRAPWMVPNPDVGFLTFALVARLGRPCADDPWVRQATAWCWEQLPTAEAEGGYTTKFALSFLDSVADTNRAAAAVERLRHHLSPDASLPVPGGVDGEKILPLDLSPQPGRVSRLLFTDDQIESDLDRLESGQQPDGGWDFDFLHWSAAQTSAWRGIVTLGALETLREHGRI